MSPGAESSKDGWDKAKVIASLVSPLISVLLGAILGYWLNEAQAQRQRSEAERQIAVARADTVTSLLPQLSSPDPAMRRAALETVAALGDEQFAIRLSTVFGGEGAIAPVERLSESPQLRESAWEALGVLFADARSSIGVVQSQASPEETLCTAFAVGNSLFLTSGSVVKSPPYLLFLPSTGQELQATLVLHDELRGLAVLRVKEAVAPALAVARERSKSEDWLTAIGYSRGGLWRALPGRVSSGGIAAHVSLPFGRWPIEDPEKVLAGLFFLPGIAEMNPPPGFEGAPLVNDKGEIAGVLSSVAQPSLETQGKPLKLEHGVRYVPVEEIQKLLQLKQLQLAANPAQSSGRNRK